MRALHEKEKTGRRGVGGASVERDNVLRAPLRHPAAARAARAASSLGRVRLV
jgi:hypothetical protein